MEEHSRFNGALTTVADAALDSDGCLGLSLSPPETLLEYLIGIYRLWRYCP